MNISDPVRAFAAAIARDMGASVDPVPGEVHRFDCPDGKRGNRAGWYVLNVDGLPRGAYGSWRTGSTFTWRMDSRHPANLSEQVHLRASMQAARAKREQERTLTHQKSADRASALWRDGRPANADHPYLVSKGISSLCLRQRGDVLLVPLRTINGTLVNLQRIFPNGTKLFLRGGRIVGAFALFGRALPQAGPLYLAEGWATAATIANTLRQPVVAAMTAGNLLPVARAIRAARPELELILAADNDHRTPDNPGISKATVAARAVGGGLVWPRVCGGPECQCTDFNDLANCAQGNIL